MKLFKPKFWNNKYSLISFCLLPVAILFQFLLVIKKKIETKVKFETPIICVGNLYLGGTGKTPLCIEVAKILKKSKKKSAIIKKFYNNHHDEFRLIESRRIKLFKNKSRIAAIKEADRKNYDCLILDDGLQDTTIDKNLKIVCFNEKQLAGNEMTLPSGPLREPLSSLKNNQIIVINGKVNKIFEKRIKSISKDVSIYYTNYIPANLNKFKGQNLLAFAGIGNPNNFFNLLERYKLKISKKISFPDHYNYSAKELKYLVDLSKSENLRIITTEKDYFRIRQYKIPQINYLDVKLEIKNKDKFKKEVFQCLF